LFSEYLEALGAKNTSSATIDKIFVDELQLKIGLTWWDKTRLKMGW
jgi:hypothetical protein